jgi:hypothetical protein
MVVESAELSKIEAGDSLHSIIVGVEALIHHQVDQVEVLLLVEKDAVLLPELLGVAWTPPQLPPHNLVLELLDGAEHLLVLVEILEEALQHLVDVIVNPVAVLQFDDEVQSVNVREVFLANGDLLEVVEEHQHDPRDLLPAEEVQDLGHLLDDGDGVILEVLVGELVVGQNPQDHAHVVADLGLLKAWSLQEVADQLEALRSGELTSQLIRLEQGHQSESVRVVAQLEGVNVSLLH